MTVKAANLASAACAVGSVCPKASVLMQMRAVRISHF